MLEPGLGATVSMTVGPADLAPAHRSGDVPVLATPRVVALCEEATVAAVSGALGPGETTVGIRVDLEHLAPSAPGAVVQASAVLESVGDRRLRFRVTATCGGHTVATGTVSRVVVDRHRFAAGAGVQ